MREIDGRAARDVRRGGEQARSRRLRPDDRHARSTRWPAPPIAGGDPGDADGARELARADVGADHRHARRRPARTRPDTSGIPAAPPRRRPPAPPRPASRHSPSGKRARCCSGSAAATAARRCCRMSREQPALEAHAARATAGRSSGPRRGTRTGTADEAVKDDDRGNARAGDAERRDRPPAEHQQAARARYAGPPPRHRPRPGWRPVRWRAPRWSARRAANRRRRRRRSRWSIRAPPQGSRPRPPMHGRRSRVPPAGTPALNSAATTTAMISAVR